jgi:hypothetical protein
LLNKLKAVTTIDPANDFILFTEDLVCEVKIESIAGSFFNRKNQAAVCKTIGHKTRSW